MGGLSSICRATYSLLALYSLCVVNLRESLQLVIHNKPLHIWGYMYIGIIYLVGVIMGKMQRFENLTYMEHLK